MEHKDTYKVVITGPPSSGKTSVLKALEAKGYPVVPEVARQVIQKERKRNSEVLPWKDLNAFSKAVIEQQIVNHQSAKAKLYFFDRGLPDGAAYYPKENSLDLYKEPAAQYRYHELVFFCPFWEEIYENDEDRTETKVRAKELDQRLREEYVRFGYKILDLPMDSVEERVNFILQHFS